MSMLLQLKGDRTSIIRAEKYLIKCKELSKRGETLFDRFYDSFIQNFYGKAKLILRQKYYYYYYYLL